MNNPGDRPERLWDLDRLLFGVNPYAADDPLHVPWREFAESTRSVTEQEERLKADLLGRFETTTYDGVSGFALEMYSGRFDIGAASLISPVRTPELAGKFKQALAEMASHFLWSLEKNPIPDQIRALVLASVRQRLQQRSAYWFAEALKMCREATDIGSADPEETINLLPPERPTKTALPNDLDVADYDFTSIGYAARKLDQYAARKVIHLRAVHSTWF